MKRFFLIPFMTLMCSVMAWGEDVNYPNGVYTDLESAITAAGDGGKVTLTDDVTLTSPLEISQSLTLDLAHHTLTVEGVADLVTYCSSSIADGISVTIKNGTYTGQYGGIKSAGNLVLKDCTIEAIINAIVQDGGSLDIDNVTFNVSTTPIKLTGNVSVTYANTVLAKQLTIPANATFTMNSGSISADVSAITMENGSTLTINGGTISTTSNSMYGIDQKGGNLIINDGTIQSKKAGIFVQGTSPSIQINGGSIIIAGGVNTAITYGIQVYNTPAHIEMKGGTINNNHSYEAYGIRLEGGASLEMSGGSIDVQSNDIGAGVVIIKNNSSLEVTGGTITGSTYGIAGNGSSGNGGTTINISGGNITGDGAGIYHPQEGTLNIKGNPVITGHTAIQLCSGVGMTGSITGGRFEAYGEDERATKGGDGLIPDGAALSIVNRSYPGGTPQFTIKGGVFLAQHQNAILAYTWSDNTASAWEYDVDHLSAREGIFSSDPSAYVPAEDYTVTHLEPTPTVYNHDEVVYANLWQIGKENYDQVYDFTNEQAEYVEINETTASVSTNIEGTVYTLNEDQSSKKVEVAENYKLVVSEDIKLNIGNGGLDLNASSQVIVEPGAVVTVGTNGITSASGTENLVLQANSEKQAALLIDPDVIQNTRPLATVILSTKARQKSASPYNYIWEYFASPVVEITSSNKPTPNYSQAVLFQGESEFITGVYTWGGNDWSLVNHWTDLVPFKGYQLTNNSANGGVEYTFKGNLLGNEDGVYAFTSHGYGYFGNSYSAPIVISNFLSALDNTVYERTVWLYDAGADTYVSVNPLAARIGSAKYKDGTVIKEIRSLQAFILNKKADGGGNAPINYRDAIWNNPRINSLVSAASAPARERDNDMQWTNIYVEANGNKELVTLVEGADFSNEFDNGADAGKYINNNSMNLYAATNDGDLAIVATDNLANTLISFQAGNATEYTLSFENGNEDYMLRDNVTGQTIVMIEGAEYSFTQAANTTAQARFEVIAIAKMPTALENVEEAAKATGIYTITGQYMGRDFTKLPAGVYVVNGVKIVK